MTVRSRPCRTPLVGFEVRASPYATPRRDAEGVRDVNIVYLRGRLRGPAQQRVLDSGTVIVNYEVTVARDGAPADSVPVTWQDPPDPAKALGHHKGAEVVVVGRVRRRFFRTGGSTQSRTEVAADLVVPARQATRATALLARRLDGLVGG